MKYLFLPILIPLFMTPSPAGAQDSIRLHATSFKRRIAMSSNPYRPDEWEKPYYARSIKTIFPSDLLKPPVDPDALLLMIGIVDSVNIKKSGDSAYLSFGLDNKYWDFTEDYSVQDETMFVSPKGGGRFAATLSLDYPVNANLIERFAEKKELLFVYGSYAGLTPDSIPVLHALHIKAIDAHWYSTAIFSYDVKRDKDNKIMANKRGLPEITNLTILKIAGKGQNK